MAFATKYKTSIMNWDGDTITAEIQEDLFTDTLEEFSPVGKVAIRIEHQTNVNVKESYIIPSKATIRMYVNDEWDMHDLLYATDRQFKVIIKNGSTVLFFGWLISGVNTEDYTTGQYIIKVTAIDGLADLKNIPYLNNGVAYDEMQTPLEILDNIIAKLGLGVYAINENNDIYGNTMTQTVSTSSPINQCNIHTKAYGESIAKTISSWNVLEHLMQAFYCRFFQATALAGTTPTWYMSKINLLGETKTYRRYSSGIFTSASSYVPLLTMGSGINHVGGKAQIGIKQGYKEINVTTFRDSNFSLLEGVNFEDEDFPTSSSLDNWGALNFTKRIASWVTGTIAKEVIGNDTVVGLDDYQRDHGSPLGGDASIDNGSGKVRINDTGTPLTTSDWIIIENEDYRGIWKITAKAANFVDINADYVSDQNIRWRTINKHEGIEYSNALSLDAGNIPEDATGQALQVELDYHIESHVAGDSWNYVSAVIIAWIGGTDYKTLNSNGEWIDDSLNELHIILDIFDEVATRTIPLKDGSIKIIGDLSSNNNFYTAGSPKFYIGLFGMESSVTNNTLKWKSAKVSLLYGAEILGTSAINTDFVSPLDIKFFHASGDGSLNEEFRFLNCIFDDATPKLLINLWDELGSGKSDAPLQDLTRENLADSYDENSQIWSGVIKGDINISNAIKDPLNFDRTFQIQKIVRNLETDYCNISMIEISPNRGYVVEQIGDDGAGGTYYFLSKTYGDISASFTAATSYNISKILNKSTSVVLDTGGDRTPDGASSFVSGRIRILVSDGDYTGADVECKGILRIL